MIIDWYKLMTKKNLTAQDLSKAFAEIPNDTTRFGVWEGDNDVNRFLKIVEAANKQHEGSSLSWIPRSIVEYNFTAQDWEPKEDLMNIMNSNRFEFFDTPQDCQNAMIKHATKVLKSPEIEPIIPEHDGV